MPAEDDLPEPASRCAAVAVVLAIPSLLARPRGSRGEESPLGLEPLAAWPGGARAGLARPDPDHGRVFPAHLFRAADRGRPRCGPALRSRFMIKRARPMPRAHRPRRVALSLAEQVRPIPAFRSPSRTAAAGCAAAGEWVLPGTTLCPVDSITSRACMRPGSARPPGASRCAARCAGTPAGGQAAARRSSDHRCRLAAQQHDRRVRLRAAGSGGTMAAASTPLDRPGSDARRAKERPTCAPPARPTACPAAPPSHSGSPPAACQPPAAEEPAGGGLATGWLGAETPDPYRRRWRASIA